MVDTRYLYTAKAEVRFLLFFKKEYRAIGESPRKAFDSLMTCMPEKQKPRATYVMGLVRKPDYPSQRIVSSDIVWWRRMSYETVTEKYKDWE